MYAIFAFLSIYVFIITSCNHSESVEKEFVSTDLIRVPLEVSTLDIAAFSFAGLLKKSNEWFKSIPQAQSKADDFSRGAALRLVLLWAPRQAEFYTMAVLQDAGMNNFLLADSIYQDFENTMQAKSEQLRNYDSLLMIERNSNGNFYNLGYHSFWVGPESNSGTNHIISVDQINGDIKVRPVNPGNGYFIRLLK